MDLGKTAQTLLSVLCAELRRDDSPVITIDSAEELLALAGRHDVECIAADHIFKRGLTKTDPALKKASLKARGAAQFCCMNQQRLLEETSRLFEEKGIDHIPLKGAVLRDLYPEPWMRTCSDIDVLVHEGDMDRATAVLEQDLHMKKVFSGSHDVKFNYKGAVALELHFRLIEHGRIREASRILSDVWLYTYGSGRCKRMKNEMLYLYHIVHMAKHFENGGCGMRSLMDLWLMNHRLSFDEAEKQRLLADAELSRFADRMEAVSEKWFSEELIGENDPVERYILEGGSFGSFGRNVAVKKEKNGGSIGYIRSRIFVPYDYLRLQYPAIEDKRYLTPVYEVVRWFRFLSPESRAHSLSELKSLAKDDHDDDIAVLREVGLI